MTRSVSTSAIMNPCHGKTNNESKTIDFLTMSDLCNGNYLCPIINLIYNAILTLTNTIAIAGGQFFTTMRSRISGKRVNLRDNTSTIMGGKLSQIVLGRRLNIDPIVFHDALTHEHNPQKDVKVPWPALEVPQDPPDPRQE